MKGAGALGTFRLSDEMFVPTCISQCGTSECAKANLSVSPDLAGSLLEYRQIKRVTSSRFISLSCDNGTAPCEQRISEYLQAW